jgi:hypothetical protein
MWLEWIEWGSQCWVPGDEATSTKYLFVESALTTEQEDLVYSYTYA